MSSSRFATLIRRVNLYPPFLGMGIRVRSRNEDFTRFEVELRERWYTRNLFGTHFGGSLYTMADPFFVFIVAVNFGRGYVVWDQSASIDFLKPAKGTITGIFEIEKTELEAMRKDVDRHGKRTFQFTAPLVDEAGVTVAEVRKVVYARAKEPRQPD
jgi:acyl-coenzyme A thioesterase PaaI-like protein